MVGPWVEESTVLAVTLLGFTFSGTQAAIVAVVAVVLLAAAWYLLVRPRQRR